MSVTGVIGALRGGHRRSQSSETGHFVTKSEVQFRFTFVNKSVSLNRHGGEFLDPRYPSVMDVPFLSLFLRSTPLTSPLDLDEEFPLSSFLRR